MFSLKEFQSLEAEFGTFTVDACCDNEGHNSHCENFCSPDDSVEDNDLSGHNVFMNSPWSKAEEFIYHYLLCKAKDPYHTSGCFVLPVWLADKLGHLLSDMRVVRNYGKGYFLFSQPHPKDPTRRKPMPGIPWPVVVYRDDPLPQSAEPQIDFLCTDQSTHEQTPLAFMAHTSTDAQPDTDVCNEHAEPPKTHTAIQADDNLIVVAKINGIPCKILIDTGATSCNVIDETFVQKHNWPLGSHVGYLNGALPGMKASSYSFSCNLKLGRQFNASSTLFQTAPLRIPRVDAVLGLPWLKANKAHIDTETCTLHLYGRQIAAFCPNIQLVSPQQFANDVKRSQQCIMLAVVSEETQQDPSPDQVEVQTEVGKVMLPNAHDNRCCNVINRYKDGGFSR